MTNLFTKQSSRKTYRRNRRFLTVIITAVIIVVALVGVFVAHQLLNPTGWNDERSLTTYANKYQRDLGELQQSDVEMDVHFDKPISYAIATFKEDDTSTPDASIQQVLAAKAKELRWAYQDEDHEDLSEDSDLGTLLIGYETVGYDGAHEDFPFPTYSVVLHERQVNLIGGEEQIAQDRVYTYNFATKDGSELDPMNIWKGNWKEAVSDQVKSRLQEEYDDLDQEALDSDKFDKYILTKDGVRFYFDAGELRDQNAGILTITLPYDDLKTYLRSDIGVRVIDGEKPMVAITYDDGPSEAYTGKILDVYEKYKEVCTFFELGTNVDQVPGAADLLKRELSLGCEVGTHSYDHPDQLNISKKEIKEQADQSKEAIENASGQLPTVARPPYGNGSDAIAEIYDLPLVNWNVDTLDWSTKDAKKIVQEVKKANLDGSIVLMHSIHEADVGATEEIVPWLREEGYQLVTVSEMLHFRYGLDTTGAHWYGYTFASMGNQ